MCFFFSRRRRHTRLQGDWSSDVCSSDLRWRGWLAEREAARALDEPPPPPVEPQPLVQRAHRIVEPRDLFEAAQRSGLREHDEGARVVVKEVPAADGREFAVPEEPDERKLAEALPDQRHV